MSLARRLTSPTPCITSRPCFRRQCQLLRRTHFPMKFYLCHFDLPPPETTDRPHLRKDEEKCPANKNPSPQFSYQFLEQRQP